MEVNIKVKQSVTVSLTKREEQIVQLTSEDLSNQQIADLLTLSIKTVEAHKFNILKKTGYRSIGGLIALLFRQGLLK